MGFDLYGENPKVVKGFSDKKSERYEELCAMSYKDREKQGLNDEYWELNSEWENQNPGTYFRNNVWWWRPLWGFTCDHCEDILTEKDMNAGTWNDGHVITEDKALAIAEKLKEALESPETEEYLVRHENARKEAKKENEKLNEQKEALNKIAITMTGDKDIIPMNYPKKLKKQFDELLEERNWASSYPINRDNIERFAEFAEQSGGFSIC
tara:strand:+ start:115 stop:744 length:630 start_codon:yes stop_codon:yes gene_type:complete